MYLINKFKVHLKFVITSLYLWNFIICLYCLKILDFVIKNKRNVKCIYNKKYYTLQK